MMIIRDGTYLWFVVGTSMCPRDYPRHWFTLIFSLLLAALWQLASAPRADASCGDWLAHSGEMSAARDHRIDSSSHVDPASANQRHRTTRLPLSKPCHGPFCRSAPPQPAPTAPASVSFATDKLALFGCSEPLLAGSRQFYQDNESDALPSRGFPARIDHPPRFLAGNFAVG
jgi:hypothetical protein